METTNAGTRHGLWNRWPATTISALAGLSTLAVLLASPALRDAGDLPSALVLSGDEDETPPLDEESTDEEAGGSGTRHKGEEGKMGKPTSKSKSGLYAMKGPKDAIPQMARSFDPELASRQAGILGVMAAEKGHFLASPYGGAFAVGSDDADVWGGLTGTEIGEAYGVGGLGLVGTGRGGGGTGEGTIGLGSGSGRSASKSTSSYDPALQSRVLTVGTHDDNADPAGWEKALQDMAGERSGLGIDNDLYKLAAPKRRHVSQPRNLDVALVIDTTGSMGDELEYLKVEIRDIARQVSADFPGVDQRWGLVVYRDKGDAYVTRDADFQSIEKFVDVLGRQDSGGGGDTPEAMHSAMRASERLSWQRDDNTARVVFLVADAPTHNGAEAREFASSVLAHRAAKTAIYPVAGSGVHSAAEAEMRLAAKVTGGQYIFLTDHSGVGSPHAAPHVEQYKVESLHDAMTRMIRLELGGESTREPAREPVIAQHIPTPIGCEEGRMLTPVAVPTAPADVWQELTDRIAAHLMFVGAMSLVVFTAMGFDTWLRRRRRIAAFRG
jgi:hypothetical protein